jgi:hypothetical protein
MTDADILLKRSCAPNASTYTPKVAHLPCDSATIRPPDHAKSGGFTGPFDSAKSNGPGLWVHIYFHLMQIAWVYSVLIINLGCMYLCVIQMFAH